MFHINGLLYEVDSKLLYPVGYFFKYRIASALVLHPPSDTTTALAWSLKS